MSLAKCSVFGLAAILLLVVSLHVTSSPDLSRRNWVVLPEMRTPVGYESQGENPNFADGRNLQPSAPGSIARGHLPLHYGAGVDEARRAGAEMKNPYAATDDAARARGAVVWNNFCVVCHGPNGGGDGTVTSRGVPAPPSLHTDTSRARTDGEIFHIITYGLNNANMPPYAAQVEAGDRWKAILHIRALQEAQAKLDAQATEPPPGDRKEK